MKNRSQRQLIIRKLINEQRITSQEQLLVQLKNDGYDLTQATLSRDMKGMKIAKMVDPTGEYIYVTTDVKESTISQSENLSNFSDGVLTIDFSGNLAVLKTRPAFAASIALLVDASNRYEVIGTIAGDDTVLIVIREGVTRTEFMKAIVQILPKLKTKLG